MKVKLLVVLLCLSIVFKNSAQEPVDPFETRRQSIFQYVDRTQVTTGLLIDYGIRYTDIDKFNGTRQSNNYLNRNLWSMLYSSMYSMKFNSNISLTPPDLLNTSIQNLEDPSKVNLLALHFKYEKFKDNALNDGLVNVSNNKIYETSNPITPYEIKHVFGMAAERSYLEGAQQIFRLRSSFFLRNVAATVSSIQVDFANGQGWQTIALDTDIPIVYSSDGDKDILMRINYSDGVVMESQSRIRVSGAQTCTGCRYSNPRRPENFPMGTFPVPVNQMGSGRVTIATAGTDNVLDKPLIIVEGFDPENRFNYFRLIDPLYSGPQGLNIPINLDYQNQTLAQALEEHQFDIVFLNFTNSTDDIKRNAYLLENLINWVNTNKTGSEKLVVMGFSMGGLVARYALRDMELRGVNHQTKLYASIDSPHQGANVPLGYQAAIRHLAGLNILFTNVSATNPDIQQGFDIVNSPAAQQMLYYQLAGSGKFLSINNSPHNNFMSDYVSKGYPQLWGIRNVAIANGSECGSPQLYAPYTKLVSSSGGQDLNYFAAWAIATLKNYPGGFFTGLVTTDADLKIDLDVRALPDREAKRVFFLKVYVKKKILWVINSEDVFSEYSFNSAIDQLPIDSSPGGMYDINSFGGIPSNVQGTNINTAQQRFNFVPTFSALDIGSGAQSINSSDLNRAYSVAVLPSAPKNSPFANFFTNPIAQSKPRTANN